MGTGGLQFPWIPPDLNILLKLRKSCQGVTSHQEPAPGSARPRRDQAPTASQNSSGKRKISPARHRPPIPRASVQFYPDLLHSCIHGEAEFQLD